MDDKWPNHLWEAASERIRRNCDARQFQIFHLHVVKGVSAFQVSRRLGVKLLEVYFAKYRISAQFKKEIKRLNSNPVSK